MQNSYDRKIVTWLLTGCVLVAAMVVIGGITRLTHSGLSIVDWKPVTGAIPPLNEEQWQTEFAKYQSSPEFRINNFHFTLDDYKSIYWWEYIHRLLGRVIGLVFLIPFAVFLYRKAFSPALRVRMWIVLVLGGLQGFIGWIMVASGLVHEPRVSHFRLALHFSTALFLLSWLIYTALIVARPESGIRFPELRRNAVLFLVLLSVQIIYGAFVAGLRAGLIYNTWPLMNGQVIPDTVLGGMKLEGLFSLINHGPTVQFIHRTLAIIVLISGFLLWNRTRKISPGIGCERAAGYLLIVLAMQFLAGIFTVLFADPVWLGVVHQLLGMLLLSATVVYLYETRPLKSAA